MNTTELTAKERKIIAWLQTLGFKPDGPEDFWVWKRVEKGVVQRIALSSHPRLKYWMLRVYEEGVFDPRKPTKLFTGNAEVWVSRRRATTEILAKKLGMLSKIFNQMTKD